MFVSDPHLRAFGIHPSGAFADILTTFAFLASCVIVGRLAAAAMAGRPGAAPIGWVLGIGAGIVPTLMVALVRWPDGQGGITNAALVAVQLPVVAAAWLWSHWSRSRVAGTAPGDDEMPMPAWLRVTRWLLLPYATLVFLYGLTAVHGFDSFSNHLAVSARWLVLGRLERGLPDDIVRFYPGNVELLVRWALSIGTDRLAFLIPFGSSVLAVWVVYRIARLLRMSRAEATASALSAATLPLLAYQSVVVYADTFTACCLLFATWLLLLWIDAGRADRRLLAGFGLAMGLALGTKYSAVPAAVALGVVWAWQAWSASSEEERPAGGQAWLTQLAAVLLGAAPASAYWFLRNAIEQGNPLYPLALGGMPGVSVGALLAGGAAPRTIWDYLTYPWVEPGYAAGFELGLGPTVASVVLLGVALAPWSRGPDAALRRVAWAVLAGSTALWFLTGATVPRFGLFPILLSCVFVGALWQKFPSAALRLVSATCWGLSALAVSHEMAGEIAYAEVTFQSRTGVPATIDALPPSRILSAAGEPATYYAMGTGYRHEVLKLFGRVTPDDARRLAPDYLLLPEGREAEFTAALPLELVGRWDAESPTAHSLWRVLSSQPTQGERGP